MSTSGLNMSRRIRRTPYTDRVEQHGVRGFSVVNHMLLPKAFQKTVEEDYWHLREHVHLMMIVSYLIWLVNLKKENITKS
jgi:dimethylsulfoniopropionate demethylase